MLQTKELKLIHYGADTYKKELFLKIQNGVYLNKPDNGGLWTSPINSTHSWKDWCKANEFRNCSEENSMQLQFTGNVWVIEDLADLLALPKIFIGFNKILGKPQIDFEELIKRGVDAIHLTQQGEYNTRFSPIEDMYGWDCETVLILNPDSIEQIEAVGSEIDEFLKEFIENKLLFEELI